jgi:hypothetical protein
MTAARPELGQSRPAQESQPVLVAPFVAPFVALMPRSNQLRWAVKRVSLRVPSSGPAKAQPCPNLTRAVLRAQFARPLLRRQLLTLRQIRKKLENTISKAKFPRLRLGKNDGLKILR